jgi:hypothetical protein
MMIHVSIVDVSIWHYYFTDRLSLMRVYIIIIITIIITEDIGIICFVFRIYKIIARRSSIEFEIFIFIITFKLIV